MHAGTIPVGHEPGDGPHPWPPAYVLDALAALPSVCALIISDDEGATLAAYGGHERARRELETCVRFLSAEHEVPPAYVLLTDGGLIALVQTSRVERVWVLFDSATATEADIDAVRTLAPPIATQEDPA